MLVKPLEKGDEVLRQRYEEALSQTVLLIPFDRISARIYAAIRRDRTIRAPDAIQLACAAQAWNAPELPVARPLVEELGPPPSSLRVNFKRKNQGPEKRLDF